MGAFPSTFSSIAIELNIPRTKFILITIELNSVLGGHEFTKKKKTKKKHDSNFAS